MLGAVFLGFGGKGHERALFVTFLSSSGHATKNTGGQIASACRTVHMGRFWVDMAGAHMMGLPGAAYTRKDSQSDSLHALVCSPWYYTPTPDGDLAQMKVCWSSKGSLLWSTCTALCFAPTMHRSMTLMERLECSVAGFVCWDLFQLLSAKLESDRSNRVGAFGMAPVTLMNLQNVSLATIVTLVHREVARLLSKSFVVKLFLVLVCSCVFLYICSYDVYEMAQPIHPQYHKHGHQFMMGKGLSSVIL